MKKKYDTAIVGLGLTGYACVQFFHQRDIPIIVTDNRDTPPLLAQLQQHYPEVPVHCGAFSKTALLNAKQVMVSQGIPSSDPVIASAIEAGVHLVSDIDIFAHYTKHPILAITGSNGKSTVTSLLGAMAKACHCNARVGGNLGPPALDLLRESNPETECYILEISNFQLEETHSLRARVACILNISPDHLDRYPNYQAYVDAKQRIYQGCDIAVYNRDDRQTFPKSAHPQRLISFGLDEPEPGMFGVCQQGQQTFLALGDEYLINTMELALPGKLNWQNSLAALTIGYAYGWPLQAMLTVLKNFTGLAHRCESLGWIKQVQYINDSKGTNVGATVAALNSIGAAISGKIIWLAGGDGKGADFSDLSKPAAAYVKQAVLFGRDAKQVAASLAKTPIEFMPDMKAAVKHAYQIAKPGDVVLLSPACASFDMFKNFQQRGEIFKALVEELSA